MINNKPLKEKLNQREAQIFFLNRYFWHSVFITWSSTFLPVVSYSPSNELCDDCEAVPVLDSRFSFIVFERGEDGLSKAESLNALYRVVC